MNIDELANLEYKNFQTLTDRNTQSEKTTTDNS
jgi:hypothetical protein